jgi:Ribonuclease G/E
MLSDRKNSQANQPGVLYRHGDVLIRRIADLPVGVQKRVGDTLAHGEVTGHSHRIQQSHAVQLWVHGSELFLEVKEPSATLIHEEHRAIELPQGVYRVWRQREYRPDADVEVED